MNNLHVFAEGKSWFPGTPHVPWNTWVLECRSKWLIGHGTSLFSHFLFQLASIGLSLLMTYSSWSFTRPSARWSRNPWLAWCSMTSCQPAATRRPASIRGLRLSGGSSSGNPGGSWGLRKDEISLLLESVLPANHGGEKRTIFQHNRKDTKFIHDLLGYGLHGVPPSFISGNTGSLPAPLDQVAGYQKLQIIRKRGKGV